MHTLSHHYEGATMRHEREQDAAQRHEEAAERAGVKLFDELCRIRRLNPDDRIEQMTGLILDLWNYDMDNSVFDAFIENLAQDTDEAPTALVMRWAGEA